VRRYTRDEKVAFARKLRRNMTPPEVVLWSILRRKQLGARFLRQRIICGFIADFYCPAAGLVIEVDGKCHNVRKDKDQVRDRVMERKGLRVARFPAADVMERPCEVENIIRGLIRNTHARLRPAEEVSPSEILEP
jgi:very-short-patch-repair endonuclease